MYKDVVYSDNKITYTFIRSRFKHFLCNINVIQEEERNRCCNLLLYIVSGKWNTTAISLLENNSSKTLLDVL